jgi:hypothetical protein
MSVVGDRLLVVFLRDSGICLGSVDFDAEPVVVPEHATCDREDGEFT